MARVLNFGSWFSFQSFIVWPNFLMLILQVCNRVPYLAEHGFMLSDVLLLDYVVALLVISDYVSRFHQTEPSGTQN